MESENLDEKKVFEERLLELAADKKAQRARRSMCSTYSEELIKTGRLLRGAAQGEDINGLATLCLIAGELARGASDLLKKGNSYGAQALIRQLVEVEYLASAFAEKDEIAAEWLSSTRTERQKFWSPAKLRARANGKFLREDYWDHCELGGHPTPVAAVLLNPDEYPAGFIWADMCGHLHGIWDGVDKAINVSRDQLPESFGIPLGPILTAEEQWLAVDELTRVLRLIHTFVRRPKGSP